MASEDRRWLTIPNAISLARLLLVAPIGALLLADERPVLTAVLIGLFGASDWIDGFLARRLGQVSHVGEVLDPVADRIGLIAIVLLLVAGGYLPVWIVAVILVTDLALLVLSIVFGRRSLPKVTWAGKIRTAVLMTGLVCVAVGRIPEVEVLGPIGVVLSSVGAVLHLVAAAGYARVIVLRRE